jgi:tRNA threonylcarbamoyl adenosine modification protein YjeE
MPGWCLADVDEAELERLGELVALKLKTGDAVLLRGDLGAGKTTLARALIRAVLGSPDAEVPSPTFAIAQPYTAPRLDLTHFDLYRLSGTDDLAEVGFDAAVAEGAVIVEWPERAEEAMPRDKLEIILSQASEPDRRDVELVAHGSWIERLARIAAILAFLARGLPRDSGLAQIAFLQGDASARAYARIHTAGASYVLMDAPRMPDGPVVAQGLPYSRIAHLAEDVRPFVAIGFQLAAEGVQVPRIHAADMDDGLLLLEDFGDLTFTRALSVGVPQGVLWSAALDVLIKLRGSTLPPSLPLPGGNSYILPLFDRPALEIELALLLDWFWPEVKGAPVSLSLRREFMALWNPVLDRLLAEPAGLFLRDFHSPNLFWLPDRAPGAKVGVIDFQDAVAGPWALDVVSLLQDARITVPADLEAGERERYMREIARRDREFDRDRFLATYAAFGAQRNTRLIGLWVRLLRRDGKPGYLQHMARTWNYLERNFEHPDLAELAEWFERHFPPELRKRAAMLIA